MTPSPSSRPLLRVLRQLLGLLLSLVTALVVATTAATAAEPTPLSPSPGVQPSTALLRVLLLTGQGTHDWKSTADALRALLTGSGRFTVNVCETPTGLTAATLAPFDLVVADCLGADLGPATTKALEAHLASGRGLVITHHGLTSLAGHPALEKLLGLKLASPAPSSTASSSSASSSVASAPASAFQVLDLTLSATSAPAAHPITQSLAPSWKTGDRPLPGLTADKTYEVLARYHPAISPSLPSASIANSPGSASAAVVNSSSSSTDQLVLLAATHRSARIFATALGSDVGAMQEAAFIVTFLRGAEWAASGQVTLPADLKVPAPRAGALRVLVLTGGHDHEAAFYSLFNDVASLGWVQVSDLKWTTQSDLRAKCDVLVMYDFNRELDDKQKALLKTFVESGKGLVVLHHGILNFQNWPWWYEEVVGGRYRLQSENGIPNSTVKMAQQHLITPVAGHPITAGLEPFRVIDETYKGLFIAPGITPLLLSDSLTSDRTVAWIGPCRTSRVVFIQLGHDHTPVLHPSYRALVRNSLLWASGNLN